MVKTELKVDRGKFWKRWLNDLDWGEGIKMKLKSIKIVEKVQYKKVFKKMPTFWYDNNIYDKQYKLALKVSLVKLWNNSENFIQ